LFIVKLCKTNSFYLISVFGVTLLYFSGDDEPTMKLSVSGEQKRTDSPTPFPLPMPAFGGYYAPLSDMMPESSLPNPPYQRSEGH